MTETSPTNDAAASADIVTLAPEAKARIRHEEIFREEIRREIRPPLSKPQRAWAFLNTPIALWVLSSVVLAILAFVINEWRASKAAREAALRQYSAEAYEAIAEHREAQHNFVSLFLNELDRTQDLISNVVVSQAVVRKASNITTPDGEAFLELLSERERAAILVDLVIHTEPAKGENSEDVLARVAHDTKNGLRSVAAYLKADGDLESAAELRSRADEIEDTGFDFGSAKTDLLVLLKLQEVKKQLQTFGFSAELELLEDIHAVGYEWIAAGGSFGGDAGLIALHDQVKAHRQALAARFQQNKVFQRGAVETLAALANDYSSSDFSPEIELWNSMASKRIDTSDGAIYHLTKVALVEQAVLSARRRERRAANRQILISFDLLASSLDSAMEKLLRLLSEDTDLLATTDKSLLQGRLGAATTRRRGLAQDILRLEQLARKTRDDAKELGIE